MIKRIQVAMRGRISMRLFAALCGVLGVLWACVGDCVAHFKTDYASEPLLTTFAQEQATDD